MVILQILSKWKAIQTKEIGETMKTKLKIMFLVGMLQIGIVNAKNSITIDSSDIFDRFQSEISMTCYEAISSKTFSKEDTIFILKNCAPHHISNILVRLNKDLFINNTKAFKIHPFRSHRNTSKLNIALLNIFRLKQPHVELTNADYDRLWNSSGLYFYYAYVLSTNNTDTGKIIHYLKQKAINENLPFGNNFFDLSGPPILTFYCNKASNYKEISEFIDKEFYKVPFLLKEYLYIKINSKELRNFKLGQLQKIIKRTNEGGNKGRGIFEFTSKYFNRLIFLSYLAKDKKIIEKVDVKENHIFFNKTSFFLIEKSRQGLFLDPYIFYHNNLHFAHYGLHDVPYHIENYRIL